MKNTTKKDEPANDGPILNTGIYAPFPYVVVIAEIKGIRKNRNN